MSICVIGNGMAGSRLAVELRQRDPKCSIVVFGAEHGPAYNRIMLSDVLAGKVSDEDLTLAEPTGAIDRRDGVAVVEIDRTSRTVIGDDGSRTRYDKLVLATGSQAIMPPIDGLREHAHVFRTLDDCQRIVANAEAGRRVVVLGGGLLGLEAARGLAGRGLSVTVVHLGPHLMERQLDPDASRFLTDTLDELGVVVHMEACTTDVTAEGVRLADGTWIPADLVVAACGVRPDVGLAVEAGLEARNGIVVDDQMRTSDPAVFAIGDCAEHRGTTYGLVAPAWEQARVVAEVMTGGTARYDGSRIVTRLKANGIDLASIGDPHIVDDLAEVVTFADPARNRYQKVVIRDGRLVGAIFLGDNPTVGMVTQLYDRDELVPNDPRSLLFERGTGPSSPAGVAVSASSVACRCNGVTAGDVVRAWLRGARTTDQVSEATRSGTGCGGCRDTIEGFIAHLASEAEEQSDSMAEVVA